MIIGVVISIIGAITQNIFDWPCITYLGGFIFIGTIVLWSLLSLISWLKNK